MRVLVLELQNATNLVAGLLVALRQASPAVQILVADGFADGTNMIERHGCDLVFMAGQQISAEMTDFLSDCRQVDGQSATVVVTEHVNAATASALIRAGVDELLPWPASASEVSLCLARMRQRMFRRWAEKRIPEQKEAKLASLESAVRAAERNAASLQQIVVKSLLIALAALEPDAIAHSLRVRAYSRQLAEAANYPARMISALEQAALLHDIGKTALSDSGLFRPGWLTSDEVDRLRPHAELGGAMLERIPFLRPAALIVRHHHERFDGRGFPEGLSGSAIPLGARIFAIADSFDAMTSDRPYRSALGVEAAIEEIQRCSGTQFDPKLVECFQAVRTELWTQRRCEADEAHAAQRYSILCAL